MSTLKSALHLASLGFHVFPLVPNSKLPYIEDYPNLATRDPETIQRWWVDPVLELEQPLNVGISTTRYGDDEALVVVDVDNKNDKRGDDEVLALELSGFEFAPTYNQITPTLGRHIVYRAPKAVKQGADVLAKGLDIRSRGGYIVGAGSVIDGVEYSGHDYQVAVCPSWIISKCGEAPERKTFATERIHNIDEKRAVRRAIHYLENEAAIAIEGDSGDQTTFIVAARVKDFGVTERMAYELMSEHWNPQCMPPWSEEELLRKVKNAYHYGQRPIGASSPEADFAPAITPPESGAEAGSYLEQMNKEYALIYMEGSHFILHETVDEKGQPKRVFLNEASFKRRFSPYTIQQGKGAARTFADMWLDWKHRREFAGVCFTPEKEPRHRYYNLWRGFTVEPLSPDEATPEAKRGFDLFIRHASENICQGDEKLFRWIMGYFAHMIQKPYERPLTTLVFRGKKGTGKNALIDRVGNLLGRAHYLVAHDSRYLTSNFNGHLDSCLCLVLDEAFWSGDKSAEGKLKGLSTQPTILIERKGKEPYSVDNLVRLVVIGNEDWVVPASSDERRYAVFNVGTGAQQQNRFFEEMRILMDDKGGNRVLLHYLKTYDLNTTDPNVAPATQGLLEQKLHSLDPLHQWWFDSLLAGEVMGSDLGGAWPRDVRKSRFRDAFYRYCRDHNMRSWHASDIAFTKALRSVAPSVESRRIREGEDLGYAFRLPPLSQAREEWDQYMRQPMSWPE